MVKLVTASRTATERTGAQIFFMNRIDPGPGFSPDQKQKLEQVSVMAHRLIVLILNELANNANIAKVVEPEKRVEFFNSFAARIHAVALREVEKWDEPFKNHYIAGVFQEHIRTMLCPHLLACLANGTSVVEFVESVRDSVAQNPPIKL